MSTREKAAKQLVATVSESELACRLVEAVLAVKRGPGLTADQAMADMDPAMQHDFRRAARAAMEYWQECIQQAGSVN